MLTCVCQGLSNLEIAQQLGLAESTVKGHVTRLMGKFRVGSRVRLALRALQLGFTPES